LVRLIAFKGVLAGLVVWLASAGICSFLAKAVWPAYASAAPERRFTLAMYLLRLLVGALATVVGAMVARRVASGWPRAGFAFGLALFGLSLVQHIQIWDQYPVWYHLVWLGSIVPMAVWGGKPGRSALTG
jgi:hypothetical protein